MELELYFFAPKEGAAAAYFRARRENVFICATLEFISVSGRSPLRPSVCLFASLPVWQLEVFSLLKTFRFQGKQGRESRGASVSLPDKLSQLSKLNWN